MRRALGVFRLASLLALGGCGASPEGLEYEPFGRVTVYRPSSSAASSPAHVAIVISGEAGWRGAVTQVARTLALDDALVLGVDLPSYRKTLAAREDTVYASADLELLSQFAQRRLGMPAYRQPVLVGFQAGGALAYMALAQGNPNTFPGALSLAFCPEVALPQPPGAGRGLAVRDESNGRYRMLPSPLQGRWIVLQGSRDAVCAPRSLEGWPTAIPHAKLVVLAGSDHELAGGRWRHVVREAFLSLAGRAAVEDRTERAAEVDDLPLIEVRAAAPAGDLLAVIVTGDGGWASIDRDIGNILAGRGVPVVGLNALRYFWTRRTPEGAAADFARIGRHYLAAWGRQRLLLIGYSRGADVLPFMVSRLPEDLHRRVELVVLMGPEPTVDFTFHLSDWVGGPSRSSDLPVQAEVEKLRGLRMLCIHGEDERDSVCPRLDPGLATRFALPGGHHFGGDYAAIAARILAEARAGRD